MRKFYTAEAVTEGHPDKLCDQIADAILDVCLKNDENSRVACEVLATKGNIIVAGEITSAYEPDVFAVVRKVLSDIGYSSEGIAMDTFVHQQSVDQHIIIWHFRRIKLCRNNAGIFHPRTPGILVITVIEKIITVITRLKMGYFNFPDSANYGIK